MLEGTGLERCFGKVVTRGFCAVPDPAGAASTRILSVVRPAFVVIAVVVGFSPRGEMMFVAAADVRAGCAYGGVTFLLPPNGEIPRLEPAHFCSSSLGTARGRITPGSVSEYDSADSGVASDQGPERWRSTPGRDEARGNSGGSPKRL